ncbi:MAG: V-type ATP synthase subunit E [Clostridia bacterium]|nr:V-type ATP synthase subunit E [Clostridia bacterium]
MTGLDNIIEEIRQDAIKSCEEIATDTQKKVDDILNNAKAEAAQIVADGNATAEEKASQIEQRGESAQELDRRKRILGAKQGIITSILYEVLEKLVNLPDKEYFELILKLVEKYQTGEAGEIALDEKDIKRIPADFSKRLNEISSGKLVLSNQTRKTYGGFVLIYGGIEENCSFKAMLESRDEQLRDRIRDMLFG